MSILPRFSSMRPGQASDLPRSDSKAGVIRRLAGAWLAILGLFVQLVAVGACPIALGSSSAFSDPLAASSAAFPICHSPSAGESGRADDPAPMPPHDCPFCAAHCQAALTDTPPATTTARVAVLAPVASPPPVSAPRRVGRRLAAAPRGPPAAI